MLLLSLSSVRESNRPPFDAEFSALTTEDHYSGMPLCFIFPTVIRGADDLSLSRRYCATCTYCNKLQQLSVFTLFSSQTEKLPTQIKTNAQKLSSLFHIYYGTADPHGATISSPNYSHYSRDLRYVLPETNCCQD